MFRAPYYLFLSRRFLPIFIVQFLGAMNDNLYRNSFLILITFSLAEKMGWTSQMPLAVGLFVFILPFFLFSATAGRLADKIDKDRMILWVKFAEVIVLSIGATIAFYLDSAWIMYGVLFLLGTQAAFFGPLKYSILPQHLKKTELLFGNAWIQAATFIAILLGTIVGGMVILKERGVFIICILLGMVSVIGWIVSFFVPAAKTDNPKLKVDYNFIRATIDVLKFVIGAPRLVYSIIGISWFWFIGATLLTIVPALVKDILGGDEKIVTFFLTVAVIGIGVGAVGCHRLLRGKLTAKFVPLGGFGMSVFMVLLVIASNNIVVPMSSISDFLSIGGISILGGIFLIGVCGGFFSVPLYALLQYHSKSEHCARNIAANNISNALFMVVSALVAMGIYSIGGDVLDLLMLVALLNILVSVYMLKVPAKAIMLPILLFLARLLCKVLFRVEIEGIENLKKAGKRAVIISNHLSLLEPALFRAFFSENLVYPVNTVVAKKWWVRPFLFFVKAVKIDPQRPLAFRDLVDLVKEGKRVVIFPEGRITVTGYLMKIYEGTGLLVHLADAEIIPICVEGAQFSFFSYMGGKTKRHFFQKIRVKILPPRKLDFGNEKSSREIRKEGSRRLYDLMAEMQVHFAKTDKTLFENLLCAGKMYGMGSSIVEDAFKESISYRKLIAGSLILGKMLTRGLKEKVAIGLMIPNSVSAVMALFGLQGKHRMAAMLNYSMGPANILKTCQMTSVNCVWTSREFVKKARLERVIELLEENGIKVKYLEGLAKLKKKYWFLGLWAMIFPEWVYRKVRGEQNTDANEAAVILFTSGSTGLPKGVVLSHRNIYTNCLQVRTVVDLSMRDKALGVMPVFHSFGLVGCVLAPIFSGVKISLYPTPLHYRAISEFIYETNLTLIMGSNIFLKGYGNRAHPYDFHAVRYIFAGADKLQKTTREFYLEKFGLRILEGYGLTEATAVVCVNTPMYNKAGSIGRMLPGMTFELREVSGIREGKELWLKGDNVMMGYMNFSNPGKIEPLADEWLNTGDIVTIDDEEFLTIVGRTKRFAKIGGEMVSLEAVEELVKKLWPKHMHACIKKMDARKGEVLLLITEKKDVDLNELREFAKSEEIGPLFVPKEIEVVEKIPLLGTGKPNYPLLEEELIK